MLAVADLYRSAKEETMIRLEITIVEGPQGIGSRTHVVKEKVTDLEKKVASAAETASACAIKNLVFVDANTVQLNVEGFLEDFGKMVIVT